MVREPDSPEVATHILGRNLTIGRDAGSDLQLRSPYVSRRHARIEYTGSSHLLSDFESTNGTLLNGALVDRPTELVHGDEITLSNVRLWYVVEIPVDEKTPALPDRQRIERPAGTLLLSVDEGRHSVWLEEGARDVSLTPLEFKLVQFLFERRGNVASRDEIGAAVWGDGGFEYDALYRLVDRLKSKIEPEPSQPRYLISHRGFGYSLRAERG
jgi:hypothetical protein